ncbi:hypothetical protein LCGC14_3108300 [marine sediment metagenome]|uniref:Cytochrome C oxidase subunit IV n=1 Tax=marine sediment metagenome TaxID=412755 RepID=A0A0F8W669_9ZZZZ
MVDYINVQGYLRWTLIIIFMLMKAGLIIAVFMHMMWERLAMVYAILLPPLCLLVLIGLMSVEADTTLRPPVAQQCHLYLWCIAQHVDWAYIVARAWGFNPIILWTWVKDGLGVGRFRCNTEHILVARRGPRQGNPFGAGGRHCQATAGTAFRWKRLAHSEKPDEFFALVEKLSPSPRLEMFARRPRTGWHVWGNEVKNDVAIFPEEACLT